jgi:nitrogen-specific signal transduction histidine kinase
LIGIPGLVAILTAAGELEFVNHQILDYTGRTLEDLKQWATSDTVHPGDHAHVAKVSSESSVLGRPYDMVHRLRRIAHEVNQPLSGIITNAGACLRMLDADPPDNLPTVTADRIQLQQVILNLLRNASDAMVDVHDRPRRLLIRTNREDDDRVHVSVRDAGVGIDAQTINKLLDAFYTTKSDGMGIGLSI